MIQSKYICLIYIIVIGSFYSTSAQNNDIRFKHYTIEDGLSQNSVFSILQDRHGFMWFGTRTGGLNKFNGYSFTSYKKRMNDSLSTSSNEILSLCEDKEGMIWIGTRNGGVNRYDENNDRFFIYTSSKTDSNSISSKTISCIFEDNNANIWFGTNYGLCMYNREHDNFIWHADKDFFKKIHIKSIIQAADNILWIGSKKGIFLYNTETREVLKHYEHDENNSTSLSESFIMALTIDAKGKLWAGTYRNGLNRLDDEEKGVFTHFKKDNKNNNSLISNIIKTLHTDRKGILWVGTKRGLEKITSIQQVLENPIFIHYEKDENDPYSINQSSIYSFYETDDDNLWIGNYSGGVNQVYNGTKKFNRVSYNNKNTDRLNINEVSSFAETNGGIWVGAEGGGLNLLNISTGQFKAFCINNANSNNFTKDYVKALQTDHNQDLWIGTSKGLYLFEIQQGKFIKYTKDISVNSIVEGIANEIWFGTNQGLFIVNKSTYNLHKCTNQNRDNGLSAKDINKVFKDSKERIWIATKTGLYKYNRTANNYEKFIHSSIDTNSISNSHCTSINESNDGKIWIGTLDGLNWLDEKTMHFKHLGESDGLPDNVVNNILFDNTGHLWLTTNKGLSKIDKSVFQNEDHSNQIQNKGKIRNYDTEDGLLNIEFRLNSSFKSSTGELFFGGGKGFNYFLPDSVSDNPNIPEIAITGFKLFNKEVELDTNGGLLLKPIWLTDEITLNHKQSVISFEFAALNYNSPSKNQYAYKLEGYDRDWNYIGTKHEATYTSLPSGNYTFRVKGSNNDNIWNEQGASIQIKIMPPIWKEWWFIFIIAGVVLAIVLQLVRLRIKKEKNINQLLELKVLKRTAQLNDKNTLLSQKTDALDKQNKTLTERQQLIEKQSEEIINQRDKLAESNKVKDKLFSVIGHDLNNPFNSILGFSKLLVENYDEFDEKEKYSYTKIILESSKSIFNLISSLLQWSRSQMGTIEPFYETHNIYNLIESNIKIAEFQAVDKNISIINKCEIKEFRILLDADLINTVIRNLVTNAIKFTNPGGTVILSYCIEEDNIIVSVKDNGVGISKEAQSKIFNNNSEYISAGTNNEQGTGLGLLLCQDFINLHKGRIWVKSKIGHGTEFCFSLPTKQSD